MAQVKPVADRGPAGADRGRRRPRPVPQPPTPRRRRRTSAARARSSSRRRPSARSPPPRRRRPRRRARPRRARRRRRPTADRRGPRRRHDRAADRHARHRAARQRLLHAARRRTPARPRSSRPCRHAGAAPQPTPAPPTAPEQTATPDGTARPDARRRPRSPTSTPTPTPTAPASERGAAGRRRRPPRVSESARRAGRPLSGASRITRPCLVGRRRASSTSERTGPIWRGGKFTTATTQAAFELLAGVVGDLRRGALGADLVAEVDRQLPGRLARLREVLDRDDPADAHVDREELVEVDRHGLSVPKRKLRYGVFSCPLGADVARLVRARVRVWPASAA